jgi:hypothetical protein
MTPDEARRLELARRAWDAQRGDDDDAAERAARRLSRRLSSRRASRDPARRVVGIGAALIAFGAAVAYASSGGFSIPFVELSAPEPPVLETPVAKPMAPRGGGALPAPPVEAEPAEEPEPEPELELELAPDAPKPQPATTAPATAHDARRGGRPSNNTQPSSERRVPSTPEALAETGESPATAPTSADDSAATPATSTPGASWAEVSRALANKDDERARRALSSLGDSPDPETRAKAKLGLAQLAASRGDCDRARALARAVAGSSEADPRTAARARALARRCTPKQ